MHEHREKDLYVRVKKILESREKLYVLLHYIYIKYIYIKNLIFKESVYFLRDLVF